MTPEEEEQAADVDEGEREERGKVGGWGGTLISLGRMPLTCVRKSVTFSRCWT